MVFYPSDKFYFGYFLRDRQLLAAGSNFIDWYEKLRGILSHNNILYVIEEFLVDAPDDSASEEEDEAFRQRHDIFIDVQSTMSVSMKPELKAPFQHMDPFEMMDAAKAHFID